MKVKIVSWDNVIDQTELERLYAEGWRAKHMTQTGTPDTEHNQGYLVITVLLEKEERFSEVWGKP